MHKFSEYDQGWCDGRDSAEIEFENNGYIAHVVGGGRWGAIKLQIRGIINILTGRNFGQGEQR